MSVRAVLLSVFLATVLPGIPAAATSEIASNAADDLPIHEPQADEEGDFLWWDGGRNMTFYQLGKILDLGNSLHAVGEWVGVLGPREAADVNALDEVPNSTWFTNRHHRKRLSPEELARGPNAGPPPSSTGPLTILSGKVLGQTPGFVLKDRDEHRYVLKFDPPEVPEMATGAEIVSSKVLHALGWNVPEYHLFLLDPARLELAEDAWIRDKYRRKRAMTRKDIEAILQRAARLPDGRIRAVASLQIPGTPKGPFRTQGVRPDDLNDTIPHEDRRELRGLRVVAAWINYTDARRGNFYDTFLRDPGDPQGRGHLVHYLLDFSSSLGSGNVEWKDPKDGNEYVVDPPTILRSFVSLGLWVKPWEDPPPVSHPALGYFEAGIFDPERWVTTYPNPLFDQATTRDSFWGSKLVTSFTDDDLRTVVSTGEWSDPAAAEALFEILRARRDRIARTYFHTDRINAADRFTVKGNQLGFENLAVRSGVASIERARYRYRRSGGSWKILARPAVPIGSADGVVELQASHDGGESWSPTTRVTVRVNGKSEFRLVRIDRETHD